MRAKDLMSRPVVTAGPGDPVHDAAALLAEHGFSALPVVDDDGVLVGILTEADVMRGRVQPDPRSAADPPPPPPHDVGEIMTTDVVSVAPGADVAQVVRLMLDRRLRVVPVVQDGVLVGILTRRDLMRCIGRADALVAADVRHRLEIYGGPGRWTVTALAGAVIITDSGGRAGEQDTDRHAAHLIAAAVPGVCSVRVNGPAGSVGPVRTSGAGHRDR